MTKEVWKIWKETYSRRYSCHIIWEVSNQGRVKKNGVPYECRLNKLNEGCKVFAPGWYVHRAVAMLFVPNPNNYNEVDHINGNPLDNRACNLRWCTHKENMNNPISKRRQSEAMKDRPKSEEHRRKISEAHKGKIQSEETRRKRSKSMKGKTKNRHRVYHDDGTYHYEKNIINNE